MGSLPTSSPPNRVLIIGAGISGLAFAHGLQKNRISYHLFERDESHLFRAQGYRVRLAGEGFDALKYLVDEKTWSNFNLTCADMRMRPPCGIDAQTGDAKNAFSKDGPPPKELRSEPRTVDRTMLREVLLKGLDPECVSYGKAFERYTQTPESVTAFFEDGSSAFGSLLVAADGGKSRVRQQRLPNLGIVDTGGRCVYGKSHLNDEIIGKLHEEVMGGMAAIRDRSGGDMLSMIIEPVTFPRRAEMQAAGFDCPEDYLYWVIASSPKRLGFQSDEIPHLSCHESQKLALDVTSSWHPSLRAIVEGQAENETAVLKIASVAPDFGGSWEPDAQVTLIGDAVGLMGPTAGSGAITALRDAHQLCQILVEEGQSKDGIGKYEETMRQYTGKTVELSNMAARHIFGGKSAESNPVEDVMMDIRNKRGT